MPDEHLSGEDERRLLEVFEQSSLQDYPNPDRMGCPGRPFLRTLAFDRKSIPITDPNLTHVTRCSPCFREFRDFREQARRRSRATRASAIAAIVLLAVGLSFYFVSRRTGNVNGSGSSGPYQTASLDLKSFVLPRGAEAPESGSTAETLQLPRRKLSLTITLPLASPPGPYEVQVLKAIENPLAAASGDAQAQNGATAMVVKLDLSTFTPGKYLLGIRRQSRDWTYYSIGVL